MSSLSFRNVLFAAGFVALGSALTITGTAAAGSFGEQRRAFVQNLVQDLDLTAAQTADLKQIKADVTERYHQARADRLDTFASLVDKIDADEPDREGVHALADARIDAIAASVHTTVDDVLDFVETLDDSQRETLVTRLRAAHDKLAALHGGSSR
jgi:hypothetical protein